MWMNNSVILPVIIPLCFSVIVGLLPSDSIRKKIGLIGFLAHFLSCGWLMWLCRLGVIQTLSVGEWLSPYGIVLAVDLFASLFLSAISFIFFAISLYNSGENSQHPFRLPLVFILQTGVSLTLVTADFFNLFVAFEVMLAASYVLVSLEMPNKELRWAFSYFIVNVIGTLGFLCAVAMIYGYTGHLNIAALAQLLKNEEYNPLIKGWSYLLLGIFGLKAGMFPLYFWLPRTYAYLPSSLAALLAGSLTKVGIYVLIRIFVILLPSPMLHLHPLIVVLSVFTMFLGVLGAISRPTIKGILSYHIVSQIGYMILGIGLHTPAAMAATLLFVVHNIWVKVSLFLMGGTAQQVCRSDHLKKMGNLSTLTPWLAAMFLIQAFSLIGLPPLSGFWGKYLLILESIRLEKYVAATVALITSWLTLFSMMKIWIGAFWQESDDTFPLFNRKKMQNQYISLALLVVACLMLGFGAEYAYQTANQATEQLFRKEEYIQAVLTTPGKGIE